MAKKKKKVYNPKLHELVKSDAGVVPEKDLTRDISANDRA